VQSVNLHQAGRSVFPISNSKSIKCLSKHITGDTEALLPIVGHVVLFAVNYFGTRRGAYATT
jgi:hypothetical protein